MIEYAAERAKRRAGILEWCWSFVIGLGVLALIVLVFLVCVAFPAFAGAVAVLAFVTVVVHELRNPSDHDDPTDGW